MNNIKCIKDLLYTLLKNIENNDKIKMINIPRYYDMGELLDGLKEMYSCSPRDITILATSYEGYRKALEKDFDAIYIYDILDFTDKGYYVNVNAITNNMKVVIESVDLLSGEVIKKIKDSLHPSSLLLCIYDSFIPKRHHKADDPILYQYMNPYYLEKCKSDKNTNNILINNMLNKLRSRNNKIRTVLNEDDKNINGTIITKKINEIKLSEILDVSRPIITPHIELIRSLNVAIREYLNVTGSMETNTHVPVPNEPLVTHDVCDAIYKDNGLSFRLPVGYRFMCKHVEILDNSVCRIHFDHITPNGEVKEAYINSALSYFDYLVNGETTLIHPVGCYLVFYGYVIPSFLSTDSSYQDGIVIYDYTMSNTEDDLYTSIIPVKRNLIVYYTVDKTISKNIYHY